MLLIICLLSFSQTDNVESTKKIQYYHSIDLGSGFEKWKPGVSTWGVSIRETHGMLIKQHVVVGLNLEFLYANIYRNDGEGCDVLAFSSGLDLRYFILKKYKWTPFLMFKWNVGLTIVGKTRNRPMEYADVYPLFDNISFFVGCNYSFKEKKSVYMALGCDMIYPGPAFRIGVRF